jgi:hypothetical protein
MANADVAKGLTPVSYLSGAPYNGAANIYYVPASDSTAIYLGDMVKLGGTADTAGVPSVTKAASTNAVVGVVVGVVPVTRSSTTYRAASSERYLAVADDPALVFEIQTSDTLAAADIGQNANLTGTSGSTITGKSTMELDVSSKGTTATLDFQILRLSPRTDNTVGLNSDVLVRLNNHQFVDGTTGV